MTRDQSLLVTLSLLRSQRCWESLAIVIGMDFLRPESFRALDPLLPHIQTLRGILICETNLAARRFETNATGAKSIFSCPLATLAAKTCFCDDVLVRDPLVAVSILDDLENPSRIGENPKRCTEIHLNRIEVQRIPQSE